MFGLCTMVQRFPKVINLYKHYTYQKITECESPSGLHMTLFSCRLHCFAYSCPAFILSGRPGPPWWWGTCWEDRSCWKFRASWPTRAAWSSWDHSAGRQCKEPHQNWTLSADYKGDQRWPGSEVGEGEEAWPVLQLPMWTHLYSCGAVHPCGLTSEQRQIERGTVG